MHLTYALINIVIKYTLPLQPVNFCVVENLCSLFLDCFHIPACYREVGLGNIHLSGVLYSHSFGAPSPAGATLGSYNVRLY
jgi:hypothetical protein